MNTTKITGISKLVSFALIAVFLIIAVGFAASGWQSDANSEPDSGGNGEQTENTDENTDGSQNSGTENGDNSDSGEEAVKKYYSYLTGIEISEEESRRKPIAFVIDPSAPTYAISSSDLAIELPIENGETRVIAYMPSATLLGKIGSLAISRPYISKMQDFFGGILVYNGMSEDESEYFPLWEKSDATLDLKAVSGYCYTENTLYVYTNGDLINAGLNNSSVSTTVADLPTLPFTHALDGASSTMRTESAQSVIIPYSKTNETSLSYSSEDGLYTFAKSGTAVIDLLNARTVKFKNVFILFADSKMYYNKGGTSFEMNTVGSGDGYYISDGKLTHISWSQTASLGELIFSTSDGSRVVAECGNTYIGYFISTHKDQVKVQ